jgi:bifunctional non-homologous end joining protein LigD
MLLNAITPEEAERYLRDPQWFMQQKADGVRCIVQVREGQVTTSSRTSKPVALTAEITGVLLSHFTDAVLDCEECGASLVIFDLLWFGGTDVSQWPCDERLEALEGWAAGARPCLSFIQTARTEAEKRAALRILQDGGAEGVVFKHRRASYSAGRSDNALKLKFKASCSLRVIAVGTNGKASIDLALADGTRVATASTIGKKVPKVGDVVEVEYLYAYRGGCLVQAIYQTIRTDVEPDTAEDLQYKGEERVA